MISTKNLIKAKLEEKLAIENKRTNEHFEKIEKANSIPEIFDTLVSIYGNTREQATLQIDAVREMASSLFFMTASASTKPNHIVFSDGDFEVIFPTSRSKTLKLKRKDQLKELYISSYKPKEHEWTCLQIEKQANKDSSRKIKEIILQKEFKMENTLFNRMRLKRFTVNEILEEYKSNAERFKDKLEKKKERDLDLEIQIKENMEFFVSIEKDISIFINNGWKLDTSEFSTDDDFKI